MPLNDSLLSAWRFATLADEGPGGKTLTLGGSASLSSGKLVCPSGGSYASMTQFALSADYTVVWKGKQTNVDTAGAVCGKRDAFTSWILMNGTAATLNVYAGGIDNNFTSLPVFTNTSWYHLTYKLSSAEMKLYIDGSHVETKTSISSGTLTINALGSGLGSDTFSLVGELDDVIIAEREWSSLDVAAHFANPDSLFGTALPVFIHHYMQQGIL